MISRILAFAGSKQSGKTTSSNFLHGYQLRCAGVITGFDITTEGKLVTKSVNTNEDGKDVESHGLLDVTRNDEEFAQWAAYSMWPYVKSYSFARPLKEISAELFGLSRENVFGDNMLKNSKTFFRWEDMPSIITEKKLLKSKEIKQLIKDGIIKYHEPGRMTHREFLQFFGTDICRKVYDDIWHERLTKDIAVEQPLLAIVDDCRFSNEVEAIHSVSGKVIYLTRNPYSDDHSSEAELKNYNNFDKVIDNANLSIHETNIKIIEAFDEWGWLGEEIPKEKFQPTPQKQEHNLVGGIHTIKG